MVSRQKNNTDLHKYCFLVGRTYFCFGENIFWHCAHFYETSDHDRDFTKFTGAAAVVYRLYSDKEK